MSTHTVRFRNRFVGYMTEQDAHDLIDKHVADGADAGEFDAHPRDPIELRCRGVSLGDFRTKEGALGALLDKISQGELDAHPLSRADAGPAEAELVSKRPGYVDRGRARTIAFADLTTKLHNTKPGKEGQEARDAIAKSQAHLDAEDVKELAELEALEAAAQAEIYIARTMPHPIAALRARLEELEASKEEPDEDQLDAMLALLRDRGGFEIAEARARRF